MDRHVIRPERVTKPIQLLAAWLVGLFVINSSFLWAAKEIVHPNWGSAMLLIAAVANVPVFIVALFLLQTKFRPQMQEDSYYSKFLDEERKFNATSKALTQRDIEVEISQTIEKIKKSIGAAAEGKELPLRKILEDSQVDLLVQKHGQTRSLSEIFKSPDTWQQMVKRWGKNRIFTREVSRLVDDGLAERGSGRFDITLTDLGRRVAEQAEEKKELFAQKKGEERWVQLREELRNHKRESSEDGSDE